jgi:hypothetical protein
MGVELGGDKQEFLAELYMLELTGHRLLNRNEVEGVWF